jgi:hypothetical protein
VDITTGKKISGNQKVSFDLAQRKTDKFKQALKNNHIQEAEPDEEDEDDVNAEAKAAFAKLSVADRKAAILDEFELDDEDKAEIENLKGPELIKKYAELLDESEDSE